MAKIFKPITSIIEPLALFLIFGKWRFKDVFDVWYTEHDKSPTIRKIFHDVFADEYPEDVDANSYVTRIDLRHIVQYLRIGPGDNLVDLGCGRGGPGLWVARETGANLMGIDISQVAVNKARHRISDFSLSQEVQFRIGSFEKTGLPDVLYNGAMSIDSMFGKWRGDYVNAVLEEVKRILCPGARFVFTGWQGTTSFKVRDFRELLQKKGFMVEACEETEGWQSRQIAVYQRIIAEKNMLRKEMGRTAAKMWLRDAAHIKNIDRVNRVLVAARKN